MIKQLTIVETDPDLAVTMQDIEEFETKFGITLPTYLSEFLVAYGGQFVAEEFFNNDGDPVKIDAWFPVKKNSCTVSVEGICHSINEFLGKIEYIPFAIASRTTLHVKITGEDAGDIYYFQNGHPNDEPLPRYGNWTFESLINSLTDTFPDIIV